MSLMVQHKDYSSYAGDYCGESYQRPPLIPSASAPEYCLLKSSPEETDIYDLIDPNELEADLQVYDHVEHSELANYLPDVPPPNYPCPQYTPYHQKQNALHVEEPTKSISFVAVEKKCEENLKELYKYILQLAIDGLSPSQVFPAFLAIWIPLGIISTDQRKKKYLEKFSTPNAATNVCTGKTREYVKKIKAKGIEQIPIFGKLIATSFNLWHQIRQITLIAALHGHDVRQDEVQAKIFSCLLGANLFKLPGFSTDLVISKIAEDMLKKVGINKCLDGFLPLNEVFNFFTNDAARVSGHATVVFAGVNSITSPSSVS